MLKSILLFLRRHPRPLFAFCILLVMLTLRVAWGAHVSKILDDSAQPFRQRQMPLADSDITLPQLPPDADPYLYYIKADQLLADREEGDNGNSFLMTRTPEDEERREKEKSENKVRALELIVKGNELYTNPLRRFQPLLGDPKITPRNLADILSESANELSQQNQPLMALDKINDLQRIIDSTQQRCPSETTFKSSVNDYHSQITAIHTLAPTLKAADLQSTRKPLEDLMRQLLDDSQVLQFTQFWEYSNESYGRHALEHTALLQPYYQASMIATRKTMIPRLDEANAPALAIIGKAASNNTDLLSLLCERRMAAVNIACQLYRMDHAETLPVSLEMLVPKYLPAVPDNLVLGNGEKIRLVSHTNPQGAPRPILFFDAAPLPKDYDFKPDAQAPHYNDSCSCISRKYRDISVFPRVTSKKPD